MISEDFFKQKSIHFKSKSGSKYYYTKEGVYRYSNHWGRVANCKWKIKGITHYKNQNYYIGYANWQDFFPINSSEKMFYLDVDFSTGKAKMIKLENESESNQFLMTLDFAIKRIKEIKTLFKDYKWATYFNADLDQVREVLIKKMVHSDKPLQALKQSLKDNF